MDRRHLLKSGALLAAATVMPTLAACTVGGSGQPPSAGASPTTTTAASPTAGPATAAATTVGQPATRATPGGRIDWTRVDAAMGKAGTDPDNLVHRFSFPRTDLQVAARGVPLRAGFALGSQVEFLQVGDNAAMFMGDLVLTEEEVNPVLTRLQRGGVDLAALHNHLLGETPRVLYLHIAGHGDPVQRAAAIRAALELGKTPRPSAEGVLGPTPAPSSNAGYAGRA